MSSHYIIVFGSFKIKYFWVSLSPSHPVCKYIDPILIPKIKCVSDRNLFRTLYSMNDDANKGSFECNQISLYAKIRMNIVKSKKNHKFYTKDFSWVHTFKKTLLLLCSTMVGEKQSNAFAFSRYQKVKATGLLMYYNLLWWPLKTKDSTQEAMSYSFSGLLIVNNW